jgi:hypothetical protein
MNHPFPGLLDPASEWSFLSTCCFFSFWWSWTMDTKMKICLASCGEFLVLIGWSQLPLSKIPVFAPFKVIN